MYRLSAIVTVFVASLTHLAAAEAGNILTLSQPTFATASSRTIFRSKPLMVNDLQVSSLEGSNTEIFGDCHLKISEGTIGGTRVHLWEVVLSGPPERNPTQFFLVAPTSVFDSRQLDSNFDLEEQLDLNLGTAGTYSINLRAVYDEANHTFSVIDSSSNPIQLVIQGTDLSGIEKLEFSESPSLSSDGVKTKVECIRTDESPTS